MKHLLSSITLLLLSLSFLIFSQLSLYAQSPFNLNSGLVSIPPAYDNSTADILIAIKKEFVAGQTISSSEMNDKFAKITKLLEQITGQMASNTPTKNVIIFGSYASYPGNMGGVNAMSSKCEEDNNKQNIELYGGITCSSVKAVLSSDNQNFQSIYPGTGYKFYDYKGNLISESWTEFENATMNLADFKTTFWDGRSTNCSNWTSLYGTGSAAEIESGVSTISWNKYTTDSCNGNKYLLCGCEY